jgi:hypothetical protein
MVKYVLEMKTHQHNLQQINHQTHNKNKHDKGVHPPTGYISLSLHNGLGSLGLISQKFFYKLLLNSNGKTNCTIEIRTHKNPKND